MAKGVLVVLLVSTLGCTLHLLIVGTYNDVLTALRDVSFNLISIATDCGFVSVDYAQWPIFVPFWMLFLSCVTASSGSTGGGIKMIRTLILTRQRSREVSRLIHPTMAAPVTAGGVQIPNQVVFAILGFIFLYAMSIVGLTVGLTLLLIFGGLDFISAFTAVIACINNAGPATNYQSLTDYEIWVLSFTNLLGLLLGFALLARHFEDSQVPQLLPRLMPAGWPGGFVLLALLRRLLHLSPRARRSIGAESTSAGLLTEAITSNVDLRHP